MTSFDVIDQEKWYHFVEQAQGYQMNVNLCRCALRRKSRGGFHEPSLVFRSGYELACTSEC